MNDRKSVASLFCKSAETIFIAFVYDFNRISNDFNSNSIIYIESLKTLGVLVEGWAELVFICDDIACLTPATIKAYVNEFHSQNCQRLNFFQIYAKDLKNV